ncbi:MAG: RES family NAD+ phosphorylase [Solirubrobacteraceae bacterium]
MVVDAGRVAAAPLTPFTGHGFRHLGPRYDPLSGEGARLHGGRFNPPGSFPVLYIGQSRPCAVAELKRLGERQAIGVEGLLPRVLHRYEIEFDRVLDLTDGEVRAQVGLGTDVLTGPDWTACQDLGVAAHALGANGINSSSATGVGDVLAVFVQHIGLGRLEPHLVEEWRSLDRLDG